MEMTYFNINFKDRVERITYTSEFLTDPTYADVVIRNPTAEQRLTACSRSTFYGSQADCLNSSITAIVDMRLNNIAEMQTSGIDWLGKYQFQSRAGDFDLGLNATYTLKFSKAQFGNSQPLDLLNSTENPIDLRLRGTLGWRYGGFGVTSFLNYTDGYKDKVSAPTRNVDSWTTVDIQLSYDPHRANTQFSENMSISLNVQNLFDRDPPFVNNPAGIGYDMANADLLGRFASLRIRKDW
jgi:outer membrane receptor protein involved in Fe transport